MTTENTENNPAPVRDWRAESAERAAKIDALLAELGITMTAEFVPYSRRKNQDDGHDGKPWECITHRCHVTRGKVTLWHDEFRQGIGHLPEPYSNGQRRTLDRDTAIKNLIEFGKTDGKGYPQCPRAQVEPPALRDVVYSIVIDSDVIDYPTFEEWAPSLGYDPDSRSAEKIYRKCLETALTLRSALGDAALSRLREAFQDY